MSRTPTVFASQHPAMPSRSHASDRQPPTSGAQAQDPDVTAAHAERARSDHGHARSEPHDNREPEQAHGHEHGAGTHGHSHGLVDESIKRSRAGVRAVALALVILGVTAAAQAAVFALSGSVALLADLIHNAGDAATAIPLAIFVSACVAGYEAAHRLIEPADITNLGALAVAGAAGFAGNWLAALVRSRAGQRLNSPALIADGAHARADAYVSLAVIASAIAVAIGLPIADPVIGLTITLVILRISWESWHTVRGHEH